MRKIYSFIAAMLFAALSFSSYAASATVLVQKTGAVDLFLYDSSIDDWNQVQLSKGDYQPNVVNFDPAKVTIFNFTGSFYALYLNETLVELNYVEITGDGYDLMGVKDGDTIKVIIDAPSSDCTVTFDYGTNGQEAIEKLIVGEEEVSPLPTELTVSRGTDVLIYPAAGYTFNSITLNGEDIPFYPSISCYGARIEDAQSAIVIDAAKGVATKDIVLTINDPDGGVFRRAASAFAADGTAIEGLTAGEQTVTFSADLPYVQFTPSEGYEVVSAKYFEPDYDGKMFRNGDTYYFNIFSEYDDVVGIAVEVLKEEEVVECTSIVYIESVAPLAEYYFRTSESSPKFPIDSDKADTSLINGYNTLSYKSNQSPMKIFLGFNNEADVVNAVYRNGEQLPMYEDGTDLSNPAVSIPDGSVIKIYTLGVPEECKVDFTATADIDIAGIVVTADRILPVDIALQYHCLANTQFDIKSTEAIKVTVDGTDLEPLDYSAEIEDHTSSWFTFTVTTDTMVQFSALSGIENVSVEAGSRKVYNLQGIDLTGSHLAPGMYIIGGKKTIIR